MKKKKYNIQVSGCAWKLLKPVVRPDWLKKSSILYSLHKVHAIFQIFTGPVSFFTAQGLLTTSFGETTYKMYWYHTYNV